MSAPAEVVALAEQRRQARLDKDFARSDALRDEIAASGWIVADVPDGFTLTPKPPFEQLANLGALPDRSGEPDADAVSLTVLVDGWPDDVRTFLTSWLEFSDATIIAVDFGNVDGAGLVLHEIATQNPGRIQEIHVAQTLSQAGWGPAHRALLAHDTSAVHVIADLSTVATGAGALEALAAALDDGVAASGWKGALVDTDDAWRNVVDAGPGEVDVVLSYLMAVRRGSTQGPSPKAMFYRNADLEWSLIMRSEGWKIVVPQQLINVRQDRHRGYHDSDPAMRDKQSRKTYDRLLQAFRGKNGILAPR